MRTAISIGARVVPVDVQRTHTGFSASCTHRISAEDHHFVARADTYEDTLQTLRHKILTARQETAVIDMKRRNGGAAGPA